MTAGERLRREGRKEGHKEGRNEGRKEGQCELLIKQMRLRFGPLPEGALARIRNADQAQLDRWAERILTAQSRDDLLDDRA